MCVCERERGSAQPRGETSGRHALFEHARWGRHAGRTWGSWRNFFPRSFVAVVCRPNALGSLVVVSIGSTRTGCNRPPFRGGELTVTLFTSPPAVGIVVCATTSTTQPVTQAVLTFFTNLDI